MADTNLSGSVKVSDNGRYFVDGQGRPFFWLGTTQWQIFRDYSREEAQMTLDKSAAHGFSFVQTMLLGVGDTMKPNVYGDRPWTGMDPLTPNERYFQNVDAVIKLAQDRGLVISLLVFHQLWRSFITPQNARAFGRWLGERYRDTPNLVWSTTPEAKLEYVPVLRELATGLRQGDGGRHLTTLMPDPGPYSSSFMHHEGWLDFNAIQTWTSVELIYPLVTVDYHQQPVKPVVMAEGAYERGEEYGFEVTPLWVRRQAYYSYLAGGHHAYGHNDSWRVLPTWKEALDAPGAAQMGVLKKTFLDRHEWWNLVPDQSIFTSGGQTQGRILNLAARHREGRWAMAYLAGPATVSIDMSRLAGAIAHTSWINPISGASSPLGAFPNRGLQSFTTPEGWDDALLILE